MKKPILIERFADNGEHSHWELIDTDTQEVIWISCDEKENNKNKVMIHVTQHENGNISHALYSGYKALETIAILQLSLQRLTNQCLGTPDDNNKV